MLFNGVTRCRCTHIAAFLWLGDRYYEAAIGIAKYATSRREGGGFAVSNRPIECLVEIVCICVFFYTE